MIKLSTEMGQLQSDMDGDGVGDHADVFPTDPTEWYDADGDGVGDHGDAFPYDPGEWRDLDGDGLGDRSDAFPLGTPTLAAYALGDRVLRLSSLVTRRTPFDVTVGVLADGRFSACDPPICVLGRQRPHDGGARVYDLLPDPGWTEALEPELEAAAEEALSEAFGRDIEIDLAVDAAKARFVARLDASAGYLRVQLRLPFVATLEGASPRGRTLRGAWVWRLRPGLVEMPSSGPGGEAIGRDARAASP